MPKHQHITKQQRTFEAELWADQNTQALDRAFAILETCGVPRSRARTVANGIAVLVTRYDREISDLKHEIALLRKGFEEGTL